MTQPLTDNEQERWLVDRERGGWQYATERVVAAREAAAEERGREQSLRQAADDWPEDGMTRAEAQRWLTGAADAEEDPMLYAEAEAERYHSRDCLEADALPCRCGAAPEAEATGDDVEALLAAHDGRTQNLDGDWICRCGAFLAAAKDDRLDRSQRQHVATALNRVLAARRAAPDTGLREAVDAIRPFGYDPGEEAWTCPTHGVSECGQGDCGGLPWPSTIHHPVVAAFIDWTHEQDESQEVSRSYSILEFPLRAALDAAPDAGLRERIEAALQTAFSGDEFEENAAAAAGEGEWSWFRWLARTTVLAALGAAPDAVDHDTGTTTADVPDFVRLGRETPWSADEWRRAWNSLSEPRAWATVVAMTKIGQSPSGAASLMESATRREAGDDRG